MWHILRHAMKRCHFQQTAHSCAFLPVFCVDKWHMLGSQACGGREGAWTWLLDSIKTECLCSPSIIFFFALTSADTINSKVTCKLHCTHCHVLPAHKVKSSEQLHSWSTQTIFKLALNFMIQKATFFHTEEKCKIQFLTVCSSYFFLFSPHKVFNKSNLLRLLRLDHFLTVGWHQYDFIGLKLALFPASRNILTPEDTNKVTVAKVFPHREDSKEALSLVSSAYHDTDKLAGLSPTSFCHHQPVHNAIMTLD